MASNERRSYARADTSFKVAFTLISREEYERVADSGEEIFSPIMARQGVNLADMAEGAQGSIDTGIIHFFVQVNEKLDQILTLLADKENHSDLPREGVGTNISGSGMRLMVEDPLDPGQIIHAKFLLVNPPLVFVDILGEVVRVEPMEKKTGSSYELGVKFLSLNDDDKEMIIAAVFRRQREAIRKRKSGKSIL